MHSCPVGICKSGMHAAFIYACLLAFVSESCVFVFGESASGGQMLFQLLLPFKLAFRFFRLALRRPPLSRLLSRLLSLHSLFASLALSLSLLFYPSLQRALVVVHGGFSDAKPKFRHELILLPPPPLPLPTSTASLHDLLSPAPCVLISLFPVSPPVCTSLLIMRMMMRLVDLTIYIHNQ